jgi:hypothetical protein
MKNKLNLTISALLITLTLVSLVSAFGVSAPYWNGNPLTMARGDTVTVNLNLQNMVGDADVSVIAELKSGLDITSLKQNTFTVKAGTSDTLVPLEITIPRDSQPGEVRSVNVEFKTISNDQSGISMGTGMSVFFDVIASDESTTNTTMIITIVIALAVLLVILWLVMKNKKRRSR